MEAKQDKIKVRRFFSDEFKRQKVKDIEQKLVTVSEISREYSVTRLAVYKWLYKYSNNLKRGITQVVQMESEQERNRKLKERIAELERALGRKQMELDFANKMVEIAGEEVGFDLKKKYGIPPLSGTGYTEANIPTK
jgi:transposase